MAALGYYPGTAMPTRGWHWSRSLGLQRIECQVELQHVDVRLTDDAEQPAGDVILDELAHLVFRQTACLRHTRHLEECRRRRDVGIEAARRCGDKIDRDRRVG